MPVRPTTSAGRAGADDRPAAVAAGARQQLGDDRDDPADRQQRRRLAGPQVPLVDGERGEERDRAVLAHRPDGADDGRQPEHRLGREAHRHRALPTAGRGEPATSPRRPRPRAPRRSRRRPANRSPRRTAPSTAAIVKPSRERHAVDAHGEAAPPGAGHAPARPAARPGSTGPAPAPRSTWATTTSGEAAGGGGHDAAGRRRRQPGEHQGAGAEAAEHRSADEVGGGDRQRQEPEGEAGLPLGDAELGGDLGHHRRQRLLADGDAEIGQADEGEGAPSVGARRCGRGVAWFAAQASRILYAIGVAPRRSTPLRRSSTRSAPSARSTMPSPPGAAARRRRRSGSAPPAPGPAWPRRWPPSSRPTAAARSTPPTPGASRSSTCSSTSTARCSPRSTATSSRGCARRRRRRWRSTTSPHRRAEVAAVIGTGRQAWPHVEMLGRTLPDLRELRICGRSRPAVDRPHCHGAGGRPAGDRPRRPDRCRRRRPRRRHRDVVATAAVPVRRRRRRRARLRRRGHEVRPRRDRPRARRPLRGGRLRRRDRDRAPSAATSSAPSPPAASTGPTPSSSTPSPPAPSPCRAPVTPPYCSRPRAWRSRTSPSPPSPTSSTANDPPARRSS